MFMHAFSIDDLLRKKYFDKATIVSGRRGLHNQIKWVHILETLNFEQLIYGNELILTTGIQLKEEAHFYHFVQKLIEKQVAGLCIEYGSHVTSVPATVSELAEAHHFPILAFHEVVPFIEITKDVHSSLINQQYQLVKRLEDYAQDIHKLTLQARHYEQILLRLYKYLNMHVVFLTNDQPPIIIPNTHQAHYEKLRAQFLTTGQTQYFASYDLIILEEKYGELCIFSIEQPIHEFDLLILDRTVIALSQFLLRSLYIRETQQLEAQKFLDSWLTRQLETQEISTFLQEQNFKLLNCDYVVLLEQVRRTAQAYDLTYYKMSSRTIFEKQEFVVFISETKNELIYILAHAEAKHRKERLSMCLEKMMQLKRSTYDQHFKSTLAVGQFVKSYKDVAQSYETAKDTLLIRLQESSSSYFYEDLYVQQILLHIQRNEAIMDISQSYLQPLLDYDKKHKSQLVHTLQMYLQCNGQKNEAAEALFIVRQTLYHRLSKIEGLIGNDFMSAPKRIMLELMLLAIQSPIAKNEKGST